MLIWGFRVYRTLVATLVYVCDRCGQQAAHHLVRRVRKLTVFFIPLVPLSTKYLDTCTACGRTLEVSREQADAAAAEAAMGSARVA